MSIFTLPLPALVLGAAITSVVASPALDFRLLEVQRVWTRAVNPEGHQGTSECAVFSTRGHWIAAGTDVGDVRILAVRDGALVTTLTHTSDTAGFKRGEVESLAFSADDAFLAVGGNGNGIKVFRTADWKQVAHLTPDATADGMAFSPNNRWFAAPAGAEIHIYEVGTWQRLQSVPAHVGPGEANSLTFTRDSTHLITGASDRHVAIVRTRNWHTRRYPTPDSVKSVRLSPDESMVAIASGNDHSISIYTFPDFGLVKHIPMGAPGYAYMEAVAWHPSGRLLFAGGLADGTLALFRSPDWTLIRNVSAQQNRRVEYIDVHGDLVLTCGVDGAVNVFRVTLQPEQTLPFWTPAGP